ncbi:uncharacterized protein C8A04DRAFT_39364 [Dichotomopilus funicola]|uniref:Phosphotransferase n=1 Tax=Dichotomopilus funicola TaxID=1934379 RepID=A0AAN6UY30_9PEZI|nr:hypothetical protein C8A04DRAFT_39364 [Dichotomopilus funicola]
MMTLREALAAALKSLVRGKSFLKALLAFWSATTSGVPVTPQDAGAKDSIDPAADFLAEAEHLLLGYIAANGLKKFSRRLKRQFKERLWSNPECMLPSYNSQLPTGRESGQFLALDIGGSTLRVALVELRGAAAGGPSEGGAESQIVRLDSFKIDSSVRSLRGMQFFDWIAERIHRTVAKDSARGHSPDLPLLMGLAWSFPIEQTSSKGGKLSAMGKGFLANEGLVGQDLGEIIKSACQKCGLYVELSAIVNDSSAALLAEAYSTPSTRFSLILGTGVNIAAHLPVSTIDQPKFGDRPSSWHEKASHVIVNTELGMFGHDILPFTRWDKLLKADHPRPDFQPLEQMVSGMYLGEICRLALVEAVQSTGVFGGKLPPSLEKPYSLDTETLSLIEADITPTLSTAIHTFTTRHPIPSYTPTTADLSFLRTLASHIIRRSASIIAASLHALWELKAEAETELLTTTLATGTETDTETHPFAIETQAELETVQDKMTVVYNGSVVEHYPGYRQEVQMFLQGLMAESKRERGLELGSIALVEARESSLRGAAVALACLS